MQMQRRCKKFERGLKKVKPIKEVIVVEGKKDSMAIRRAVQADTIETGGSAVGSDVIDAVRRAHHVRGAIVFTDPDAAGERIRRILSQAIPGLKHAFVSEQHARSRHGIGVEHAEPAIIRTALANARPQTEGGFEQGISWERYLEAGLSGGDGARRRRHALSQILEIGYANGRQFYKRLHLFRITREEFEQALAHMERGDRVVSDHG
jgi:ribonuclease M5